MIIFFFEPSHDSMCKSKESVFMAETGLCFKLLLSFSPSLIIIWIYDFILSLIIFSQIQIRCAYGSCFFFSTNRIKTSVSRILNIQNCRTFTLFIFIELTFVKMLNVINLKLKIKRMQTSTQITDQLIGWLSLASVKRKRAKFVFIYSLNEIMQRSAIDF